MRVRDVVLKTCQKQWMIGRSGERGSGISVLAARPDDDIFPKTLERAECKKGQFLNQSLTCLNSEFSFSYAGCHDKVKVSSLLNYLLTEGGRIIGCWVKFKQLHLGFELGSPCPFPTTITITTQAPLYYINCLALKTFLFKFI